MTTEAQNVIHSFEQLSVAEQSLVAATIRGLLDPNHGTAPVDVADTESALDELADEFAQITDGNSPLLSDFTCSRAGIYQDHP